MKDELLKRKDELKKEFDDLEQRRQTFLDVIDQLKVKQIESKGAYKEIERLLSLIDKPEEPICEPEGK